MVLVYWKIGWNWKGVSDKKESVKQIATWQGDVIWVHSVATKAILL
jgi:hypothetical protein